MAEARMTTAYLDDTSLYKLFKGDDWNAVEKLLYSDAGREEAKLVDRRYGNHILQDRYFLQRAPKTCIDLICEICPEIISTPSNDNRSETPIHIAASLLKPCNPTLVKDLLSWCDQDNVTEVVKMKSRAELLPLHIACAWANASAVEELLNVYPEGAKVTSRGKARLPLHYALDSPSNQNTAKVTINAVESIVSSLLEIYPQGASFTDVLRGNPLHIFAERHTAYSTPETQSEEENTLSCSKLLSILLRAYPDGPKCVDAHNRLPLHCALTSDCSSGFSKGRTLPIIHRLLEEYPDSVGIGDGDGRLPIHLLLGHRPFLSSSCIVDLAIILVQRNPDSIRHRDNQKRVPLHCWFAPNCVAEFETAVESEEFCQQWDSFAVDYLITPYPEGCSLLGQHWKEKTSLYPLNASNALLYLAYFPKAVMAAVKNFPKALFQSPSSTYTYRYYAMRQVSIPQSPFQRMVLFFIERLFSTETGTSKIPFAVIYPEGLSFDKAILMGRIKELFISVARDKFNLRTDPSATSFSTASFLGAFLSLSVHGLLPGELALILLAYLNFLGHVRIVNNTFSNDDVIIEEWITKDTTGKLPLHHICSSSSLLFPPFDTKTSFSSAAAGVTLDRGISTLIPDSVMTVLLENIMITDIPEENLSNENAMNNLETSLEHQDDRKLALECLFLRIKALTKNRSHLESLCFVLERTYGAKNLQRMLHSLDNAQHCPLHCLLLTRPADLESEEAPSSDAPATIQSQPAAILPETSTPSAAALARNRIIEKKKIKYENVLMLLSIDAAQATICDCDGDYPFMMAAAAADGDDGQREKWCVSSTYVLFRSLVQQQDMNWSTDRK